MKLGETVRIKNLTMTREIFSFEDGKYERFENDQYSGALAMITRITGNMLLLDILPQCRSQIDTASGWRVKDLLFSNSSVDFMKDNLVMEVE